MDPPGDLAAVRLYRCVDAYRWETGGDFAHLPRCEQPFTAGRWNDQWQFTLYTSHEAPTTLEEKRRHLLDGTRPSTVAGSLLAARTAPAVTSKRVVVVSFDMPKRHASDAFDVRDLGPAAVNRCLDHCNYWHARQVFTWKVRGNGQCHLIAPASPRPGSLNSILYFLGWRQPPFSALPRRDEVVPSSPVEISATGASPCW